jgi:hypothetical protein
MLLKLVNNKKKQLWFVPPNLRHTIGQEKGCDSLDPVKLRAALRPVLYLIRFPLMDRDEFYEHIGGW